MAKKPLYMQLVKQADQPAAAGAAADPATPIGGLGDPPDYLLASATAVKIWHELAAMHPQLGPAERTLFTQLVIAEQLYREAQREVTRVGTLIKSPTGYPIQNPYLAVLNKQQEKILRTSQELGITPLARSRVKPSKQRAARPNPFKDLRTLDD